MSLLKRMAPAPGPAMDGMFLILVKDGKPVWIR